MTSNAASHPVPEKLLAFVCGDVSDVEWQAIETHLSACDTCMLTLDSRSRDRLIDLVRGVPFTGARSSAIASSEIPPELTEHPRYRVVEVLGMGGMGIVYKAEHRKMRRFVALKTMNRHLLERPEAIGRFEREVRAAARLAHPNIVTAFDADQAGDTHFLVMEFVPGRSLAHEVAERGPLPIERACEFARQTALGLQHAHEQGMVHRDIKPQNLMLTPDGTVKILDFGLSRFASEEAIPTGPSLASQLPSTPIGKSAELTGAGLMLGTADYIAPEQVLDPHAADIRADIYALGGTLYFLLMGGVAFPAGSVTAKLAGHREQTPPALAEVRSDAPPELAAVVSRMMAKHPSDRFQTPAEVAAALAPFCGVRGETKSAAPARRRIAPPAGAALATLVFLVIAAWQVIRILTADGELVIESSDPLVAVVVKKDKVRIVEPSTGRKFTLPPGQYELETADAEAKVVISKSRITIERSRTTTVQIGPRPAAAIAGTPKTQKPSIKIADTSPMRKLLDIDFAKTKAEFPEASDSGKRARFFGGEWVYAALAVGKGGRGQRAGPQPGLTDALVRDFVFESEVITTPGGTGTWSLCFSYLSTAEQWMFLNVSTAGTVSVNCQFDGKKIQWPIPTTPAPSLRPAGEANLVRLEVIDHRLRVFVNGEFVAEGSEPRQFASSLYIGLAAENPPIEFRFRKIRLWQPEVTGDAKVDREVVLDAVFSRGLHGFQRGDYDHGRFDLVNGELQYFGKLRGGWVVGGQSALGDTLHDDFVLEAEFRIEGQAEGGWNLRFNEIEGQQGAFFHVRADGRVGLEAGFGDKIEWLIPWTQAASMRPASEYNRVRLESVQHQYRIFVNDELIGESTDERYEKSQLHLYVIVDQPPLDLRFRRIRLWRALPNQKNDPIRQPMKDIPAKGT